MRTAAPKGWRSWGVAVLLSVSACAPRSVPPTGAPEAARQTAPTPPPQPDSDKLLVTETEYQGWRYFQVYCTRCHGEDALGALDAPDLTFSVSPDGSITRDSFVVVVRDGSANQEMKGFRPLIDDQLIGHIYAYLLARSEGRLAPGRPHRAPANP